MRRYWMIGLLLLLVACQSGPAGQAPDAPATAPGNPPSAPAPGQAENSLYPASIEMVDEQHGWAIAQGRAGLYRTADGGQTWTSVTPPGAESSFDLDLVARSQDRAWLVLTQHEAGEGFAPVVVFRTVDGGAQWERAQFVTAFRSLYGSSVHFLDDQHGFVLVEPEHGMSSRPGVLYGTTDGGRSWTEVAGADRVPFAGKVGFSSGSTGWIVGHQVSTTPELLAFTADGGLTWTVQDPPQPPPDFPPGQVSVASPPLPVGGRLLLHAAFWPGSARADAYRSLLYTVDAPGQPWVFLTDLPDSGALSFLPEGHGWLWAGAPQNTGSTAPVTGAFRITADGGHTWAEVKPESSLQGLLDQGYNIVQLDFVSARTGWALLRSPGPNPPRLARTTDGGKTWTVL